MLGGVDVAGVAKGEVLHAPGEGFLARLQGEMDMIGHEAEGMDPIAEAAHAFGEQLIERATVLGGEEDVLPGVAAQDHVVEGAGDVQAGFAGHLERMP